MTAAGERCRRGRGDRGDVMLMTMVLIVFLMAGCWALVSGSQQWGARRNVQAAAAAAARAAAQIGDGELRNNDGFDSGAAAARAQRVLAASGCSGSVSIAGNVVTVTATQGVDYAFPAPGFPGAVTGVASANAVAGVRGDEGG
jgi:Flp pilus assembly protein TadG